MAARLLCGQISEKFSRNGLLRVSRLFQNHPQAGTASAAIKTKDVVNQELQGIKEAGTWKAERVITSRQGPSIDVAGSKDKILNFCANNYLGLSSHPEVIEAGKKALDTHGAGLSSVRFICGTMVNKNIDFRHVI